MFKLKTIKEFTKYCKSNPYDREVIAIPSPKIDSLLCVPGIMTPTGTVGEDNPVFKQPATLEDNTYQYLYIGEDDRNYTITIKRGRELERV